MFYVFSTKIRAVPSGQMASIIADKPILVGQFVESDKLGDSGAPSLFLVPPVEQFKNYYVFGTTSDRTFSSYLVIIVDLRFISGMQVSDSPVLWIYIHLCCLKKKNIDIVVLKNKN